MIRLVIIVFLLANISVSKGQQVDSLEILLYKSDGARKLDLFRELVMCTFETNPVEAIKYSQAAVTYSRFVDDTFRIVRAYRNHGLVLERRGDYQGVVEFLTPTLIIAARNHLIDEQFKILNLIGCVNIYLGKYDLAFEYFQKCLSLDGGHAQIGNVYNNIGLVFYKLEDFEVALSYFKKSIESKPDERPPLIQLANIALALVHLRRYDDASQCYDTIRNIWDQAQPLEVSEILFGMGVMMSRLGQLDSSKIFFRQAIRISEEISDTRMNAECRLEIAKLAMKRGNFREAEEYLDRSQRIAEENRMEEILESILEDRIDLSRKVDNLKELSFYNQQYIELTSKLRGKIVIDNIRKSRVKLLRDENRKTLVTQQSIMNGQKKAADTNRFIRYVLCCFFALLVIVVVLAYRRYRHNSILKLALTRRVSQRSEDGDFYIEELKLKQSILNRKTRETAKLLLDIVDSILANSHIQSNLVSNEIFNNLKKLIHKLEEMTIQ